MRTLWEYYRLKWKLKRMLMDVHRRRKVVERNHRKKSKKVLKKNVVQMAECQF